MGQTQNGARVALGAGPSGRSAVAHGPAQAVGVSPAQTPGER